VIVAMAGLPGTGKSTLAARLATHYRGAVVSKDALRAAAFPAPWTNYTAAQDDFTMSLMLQAAQYLIEQQQCPAIFLDGRTFSRAYQRRIVHLAAERLQRRFHLIECICPDHLAIARIQTNLQHPAANRDQDLYWRVKSVFEPIVDARIKIDTSQPLDTCVNACIRAIGPPESAPPVPE
jgi:predicted kinase